MKANLSHEEISSLALELSLLLHAGVTVADGLSLMAQGSEGSSKELLSSMAKTVDGGESLAAAFRKTERFPVYVCGLMEVGEKAGRTEEALTALANYYEGRARTDRRIKSALLYPAVMLVLMLAVIGVLLVKVLPIFDDVYASLGSRLTGVAGGLLTLGRWLGKAMPVLLALLVLSVIFLVLFSAVGSFREKVLAAWRKARGDKGVSRKLNNARLAQALAMAMGSGLPVEEALELARGIMEDVPGASARCLDCQSRMENGSAMGEAMRDSGILSAGDSRLLELAQRSGSADAAMARIAAKLSEESEAALEDTVSRVEPTLVLICSLLVGLILLSVMLPLTRIMAVIG
ncbi:MAG: type II secretion system F family protein [Oscillospiraceae bacterium]|nr:type II secretion system F family protein [Oscillospiraceae bacterium]MBP3521802.1 type II secretion system F family protein [Oscillospiraceae bacterium]